MAIAMYFPIEGLSTDQYNDIDSKLTAAGANAPKGRTYHCAFGGDGEVQVFDVWNSQEEFDAFGETLLPLLGEAGVTMPEPQVAEVRNIITG